MRVPKKVICEFADMGDNFICEVGDEGWGDAEMQLRMMTLNSAPGQMKFWNGRI